MSRTQSKNVVYMLVCPISREIRYVGLTTCGPAARLRKHVWDATRAGRQHHVHLWIAKLLRQGKSPEISVIQSFDDKKWLSKAERYWISYFLSVGCDLCNHTTGGETNEMTAETRTRIKAVWSYRAKPILDSNGTSYTTAREAARILGLDRSAIMKIGQGKAFSIGGLSFVYITPKLDTAAWLRTTNERLAVGRTSRKKIIDQFGVTYPSITALASSLGVDPSDISKAARGIYKSYKGLVLRFVEEQTCQSA